MGNLSTKTGTTPVQTRISLTNNGNTPVQNFSAYDAQELTGFVFIDATTDYRASVKLQVVKNGAGVYEVAAADIAGDDNLGSPIVSFSMSGSSLVATLVSYAGFVSAYIQFNLNAPALGGSFPLSVDASQVVGGTPAGALMAYAGATEPTGWIFCYGQEISRTVYANLFNAIGTIHGVGNGTTTFNVPDMRGRVPAGKDNMGGVAANRLTAGISGITGTTLGAVGGSESMHQHSHTVTGTTNIGHTHGSSSISGTAAAQSWSHTSGFSSASMGASGYSGNHTHSIGGGAGIAGISSTGSGAIAHFYWATNPGWASDSTNIDHVHNISVGGTNSASSISGTAAGQTLGVTNVALASGSAANTGAGGSQNIQPTLVLNYIIKT